MDTHRQRRRFATLGLVVLVATAGCSATAVPSDNPPPASRQARARYDDGELAFTYPTSWKPHKYQVMSSFSKAIVYLSNQPLHEPCTRHRSASSLTITCAAPVDHLAPGGVLAMWSSNGFPSWQFSNAKGAPLQITGRPAKLGVDRPGSCAEIGADETITAVIPRHALSDNWYQLWACLRGPALDQHDREVRQLLASTTVHD